MSGPASLQLGLLADRHDTEERFAFVLSSRRLLIDTHRHCINTDMKTFSGYDVKKFWADELFWVDAVSVDDVLMKVDGIDAPDADIEGLAGC